MLQQTTVAAALPYFARFLERFPDLPSLARASEREVLQAWAGLGYYSRARNLLAAARRIQGLHGGRFPERFEEVLALPGVGRYTAGAILSIAFGRPHAVLDGNVARVLTRLFALRGDPKSPAAQRRLWSLAEELLDRRSPGDWNQAMMELGATVCLPESPGCGACPVLSRCQARRRGLQDRLPEPPVRPPWTEVSWTCLWIEQRGRVLLWRRSQEERLLKGLWGLPEARRLKASAGAELKRLRHTITYHRLAVSVRRGRLEGPPPPEARWVPRGRLREHLVSSLWLKCL